MYYGKPEHVDKMKNNIRKEFEIVEYSKLRKLLGVQHDWKIFESGEIYLVMSMNDKVEEIINHYENYTGKIPKNYPSLGASYTTLQKNSREKINMK